MRKNLNVLVALTALSLVACDKQKRDLGYPNLQLSSYRSSSQQFPSESPYDSSLTRDQIANESMKGEEKLESLVQFKRPIFSLNIIYKSSAGKYFVPATGNWYLINDEGQVMTQSSNGTGSRLKQALEYLNDKFRWDGICSECPSGVEEREGKAFIKNWARLKETYSRENWQTVKWSDI